MIWALVGHGVTANEIYRITDDITRIIRTTETQSEILAKLQGTQGRLSEEE